ncbi:hypothetical protein Clacol_000063 [Clathrus columnatus]|uniref:No apical meristem-associated C-terminal domain-containing protein n=1 Tax=Clathrus columnatus TaxID=1419009 RepID=A0AAV4ZYS6_9AGAM|nr:hypothetical protein Clacol_000063 [Clathrus columnatus]
MTTAKTSNKKTSNKEKPSSGHATKDAKAEDRQKNTAKSSKASFHGVLAKYIFDKDNTDDEQLCNNYQGDSEHYAQSVGSQLQRLKKKYKECCEKLGATGAGLNPEDIREGSEIANKHEQIRNQWPFWDWLHAMWHELPNYNPVGVSTTGSHCDFADDAAGLWETPDSPLQPQSDESDTEDDNMRISSGVAAADAHGEEDEDTMLVTPGSGTNPPAKHFSTISHIHSATTSTSISRSTTPISSFASRSTPVSSAITTTSSSLKKGKKQALSDLLNSEYDMAESEQQIMERKCMQLEERLARYAYKSEQVKLEQQREANKAEQVKLEQQREAFKFKLSIAQIEAYKSSSVSHPLPFMTLPPLYLMALPLTFQQTSLVTPPILLVIAYVT